ncbi:MAG: phosphatidate cytidylyltransferase [Flavisolibacter sp.]
MAFNWQTFKTRSLTAAIFVVVMLAGLLWNRWSFFLLFSVVHFGAWIEYRKLVIRFNPEYEKIISFHRYGIVLGGWCLLLFFTNNELHIFELSLTDLGYWCGLLFMILLPLIMFLESKNIFLKNIGYSIFGLLYISLPLALLINLRNYWSEANYQLSHTIPLLLIFSLWINDTMAYIVGSLIGKTPLSPISPKKTWEGTIGGIILTIVVISLLAYYTGRLPIVHAAILSAIAAISGTFGDLFESKLKRLAGVKDSGSIMPGHGGFLDRFDSLLFASIFGWLYAMIFIG